MKRSSLKVNFWPHKRLRLTARLARRFTEAATVWGPRRILWGPLRPKSRDSALQCPILKTEYNHNEAIFCGPGDSLYTGKKERII